MTTEDFKKAISETFFDITEDPVIKSIIELERKGLTFDREILNDVLFELFLAGKSQATKEILEEVNKIIDKSEKKVIELRLRAIDKGILYETNMKRLQKYHVFEMSELERIKQQLKKLGENGK